MNNETAATTMTIELAVDQPEGAEFAAWLRSQGYDASVGRETSATLDGASTLTDADASSTLAALWEEYCQS